MRADQKLAASIVITGLVTITSVWLNWQSPPSLTGRFVVEHEDILFPFAWLFACLVGHALLLVNSIGILQFPIYSFLLCRAWFCARLRQMASGVFAAHIIAVALCKI